MLAFSEYLQIFVALIAIISPFTVSFVFLALCEDKTKVQRHKIANQAALFMVFLLCLMTFFGKNILDLFSIRLASFKISGGILLSFVALDMLQVIRPKPKRTEDSTSTEHPEMLGVIPLALPILAGPGAMSSVIIYAEQGQGLMHLFAIWFTIACIGFLAWLSMRLSEPIKRFVGQTFNAVFSRLMGLVLLSIAIEFLASGLLEVLPGLAG